MVYLIAILKKSGIRELRVGVLTPNSYVHSLVQHHRPFSQKWVKKTTTRRTPLLFYIRKQRYAFFSSFMSHEQCVLYFCALIMEFETKMSLHRNRISI